jgi:hypothetical protein
LNAFGNTLLHLCLAMVKDHHAHKKTQSQVVHVAGSKACLRKLQNLQDKLLDCGDQGDLEGSQG